MLLGDAAESGGWLAVAALAGGGISWVLTWWNGRSKINRDRQLEDEDRDRARQDELYERMKADRDAANKREQVTLAALDVTRAHMIEVRVRDAAKSEHNRYLEGLLDEHQIPHRKWDDRRDDLANEGQIVPHGPDQEANHDA